MKYFEIDIIKDETANVPSWIGALCAVRCVSCTQRQIDK